MVGRRSGVQWRWLAVLLVVALVGLGVFGMAGAARIVQMANHMAKALQQEPPVAAEPANAGMAVKGGAKAIEAEAQVDPVGFDKRAQAQEAIERVLFAHRTWPVENASAKPVFEDVYSHTDLEAKVNAALLQSAALDKFWQSPITAKQLQAEMDRMARGSQSPETLREMFAALGNDPALVAECLARPALADRLLREKYANDTKLHEDARRDAQTFLNDLTAANFRSMGGDLYHPVRIQHSNNQEAASLSLNDPETVTLGGADFAQASAQFPVIGQISGVIETPEAFVILSTDFKNDALLTGGAIVFPKKSFESWWSAVASDLQPAQGLVAGASYTLPTKDLGRASSAPASRPANWLMSTAVNTGAETLYFGGGNSVYYNLGTGLRYSPATDSWTALSAAGAPSARWGHTAVWTGTEMVVWGGYTCAPTCVPTNTGARYNALNDTWQATSTQSAPAASYGHAASWSGTEMVVTGGVAYDAAAGTTNGRYNPSTDSWTGVVSAVGQGQSSSNEGRKESGTYTVGTGGTYTTLKAAFDAINAGTITGAIVLQVISGTTETAQAVLNYSGNGSASYTSVTIYPTVSSATITGSLATSIIELYGASNVMINGAQNGTGTTQNLTISNSNTGTTSTVVWLATNTASHPCTSDTIQNCIITGNASTTTQYGIYAGSSTIGSAAAGAQSNNTIQNCLITTAQNGIFVYGYATSPYDSNWTITGNTTGSTTTAAKMQYRGISIQNATNAAVNNNTVLGVTASTSTSPYGIYVGTSMSGGTINGNVIHDVKNTRTTSTMCAGLDLSCTTTASNLTVANNVIYDVASYGAASFTTNGWGMYITSGGGYKIYYNSIRLTTNQTSTAAYPAALNVGSGVSTASSIDLRNNVIVNSQTVGAYPMAILIESAITVFSNLDYNDEYAALGYTGGLASTIYSGAAAWQTATGKEAHSISIDPLFASTTNLKPQAGSPVFGAATPVAVTTDFTGATRSGSTPSMGAYECGAPYLMYALLLNTTSTSNPSFTGVTITANCGLNTTSGTKPRVYYKRSTDANAWNDNTSSTDGWKYVEANGSTSPFDFTIDYSKLNGGSGVSAGNTVQYFVVAQDNETTPQVGIRSGTFAATPATVALTSAAFPIGGTIYSYIIPSTTYSGAVTVGTGGTFTSLTNTGGLFDLINQGVLSGSVTATITSDLTSETGTVALNAWGESGAGGYTLTIQPSGARTISGTNATALIKLNGADRVNINGLNTGGNTLNITNTNTGATATVIWLGSANAADGANNNTIQNCTIYGAGTSTTVTCISGGSGTTMGGAGEAPNNNNTIQNNTIYEAQNGIWINGPLTSYDQNWTVSGNTIGSATAAQMMSYRGIGISNAQNFAVNNNTVSGITSANASGTMAIVVYGNANGGTISSNIINNIKCTYNGGSTLYYGTNAWGICLNAATTASNVTVANNVIYDVSSYGSSQYIQSQGVGIMVNTGGGYNVWYNSIYMGTNQTQTSGVPACISVTITQTGGLDLRNNSLYMAETVGTPRVIYSFSPNTVYSHIDYNDYYQGTATYLGIMNNATNCSTLAAWQTASAQDTHSKAANPTYTSTPASPSTNNLVPLTGSPLISAATPVSVTTDFLGVARNNSTPTMGAYEVVLCTTPGVPTITGVTVPADNQLQVAWTAGTPAGNTYNIYRSTGACPGGTYTKVASAVASSPWTDSTVSGTVTYSYEVTGVDTTALCESAKSSCVSATATGICTAPPTFAGLASVTNNASATCTLNLAWSAGSSNCAGTISYTIYRSTSSSFTPGAGNLLVSGLSGTTYSDVNVLTNGTTYYYIVQAVDSANSTSDGNVIIKSGTPTGTVTSGSQTDTFEAAGGFDLTGWTHNYITGTQDWAWSTAQHHDGTHSWFASDIASASDMVLVTPSFSVQSTTTFSFWHMYTFEANYDGGTIEYTTNGGTTWTVIPAGDYVSGAPTVTIPTTYSNPIGGLVAYSGTLASMTQVTINVGLDANMVNKTVKIRFHEGNDSSGASTGWYIDTVAFNNIVTYGSCTSGCVAPGAPTLNTATGDCSGVNLSWTAGSGTTSRYNVYRSTNTSCPVGTLTKLAGPITATTYSDTTAVAGTTYTYVVRGTCDTGGATESANSNCLAAARLVAAPTITGASSGCAGSTVTLTTESGMSSYQWYLGGTTIGGANSETYGATADGTYTVSYTGANGCPGTSAGHAVAFTTLTPVITGGASGCAGTGVNLSTDSGMTSYQWYLGGTAIGGATSNTYTATATGTYTVSYTDGNGCSGTSAAHAVTINTPATPTISGSSTNTCPSGSVTLTTEAGMTNYQWYQDGNPVGGARASKREKSAKDPSTYTYSATATGTYTVSYTDANGCATSQSAGFAVTITTAITPAITGAASGCGSVLLSTDTGKTNYQWSNAAGIIPGATNATYTATASDTYTVSYTDGSCSGTSAGHAVTIFTPATATISGPSSNTCPVGTVTLTTEAGMTGYIWTFTPSGKAGKAAPSRKTREDDATFTYQATATGSVTVSYTDANGCTATSAPFAVTINTAQTPAITGPSSNTCPIPSVTLSADAGMDSYQWYKNTVVIPTATTQTYTAYESGNYTVATVYGACSGTSTTHAVTINAPPTPTINGPSANVCPDGTVTLTTEAGMSGYTWNFTASGKASKKSKGAREDDGNTYVATASGTVTVTYTDGNGCTGTSAPFTVTINTAITPTISGASSGCGTIALSTESGFANYQWFLGGTAISGANAATYGATASGTYTVYYENGSCNGTSAGHAVTISAGPTPTVSVASSTGCPTPSTTLTTEAGMSGYIWNFTPSGKASKKTTKRGSREDDGNTYVATAPGTVTVTYTDPATGCSGTSAPFTVTVDNIFNPTVSGSHSGCNSVLLTATAGDSYQWFEHGVGIFGATAQTYTATGSDTYSVMVYYGACVGTSDDFPVTITAGPTPTISGDSTNTCPSVSVTLTTEAGMSGYIWNFTPSGKASHKSSKRTKEDDGNTYSATASGTVTVTYTDPATGCSGTSAPFTVTINTTLTPTISGATSGCSSVALSTQTGFANYQWFLGGTAIPTANSATYSATASGTYTVYYENGSCNGTSAGTSVTINAGPTPAITGPAVNVCPDGTVTLTTQSGMASYNWTFTPSGKAAKKGKASREDDATNTYVVSASGSVTVTVTDSNGCTATSAPVTVTITTTLAAPVITGPSSSCGTPVILFTDLVTGYTYQWSNLAGPISGATGNTYSASTADTYTVTVTSGACTGTSAPHPVTFTAGPTPTITGPSANVCPDDTVTLTTQAGMASYIWNFTPSGKAANKAHGKRETDGNTYVVTASGSVTVTVTDSNGCTATSAPFAVTISNSLPAPVITGASSSCGTPVLLSTPLVDGYIYQWSKLSGPIAGGSGNTYSATTADIYTVTVYYGACNGISAPHAVAFNAGPTPTITGPSANVCPDGTVTLTTQPGMASYDWTFTPSGKAGHKSKKEDTSNTYVVSASGSVTVTVTDTNGCSGTSASFPVIISTSLPAPVITGAASSCGTPVLLSTDLVAGYTYQWSNLAGPITGATSNTYSATAADTYTVTVTSGVCSGTSAPHAVAFNAGPTPTITGPSANVCPDGTVTLTTQSGMASYDWTFTPSGKAGHKSKKEDTSNTYVVTASGSVTVTVTDTNGCSATSAPFPVIISTSLPAPVITGAAASCGTPVLLSTDLVTGYSYQWSNLAGPITGATSNTYSATAADTYTVTVTSGVCSGTSAPHAVAFNAGPTPTITGPSTNVCPDGTVTLTTQSGMSNYIWIYDRTTGTPNKGHGKREDAGNTYEVTALGAGTVTVTYTDGNGCTGTSAPFAVTISTSLPAPAITGASASCGTPVLLSTPLVGGYTYQWSNLAGPITGATSNTYSATAADTYTVTVTSGACSGTSAPHAVVFNAGPTPTITGPSANVCPDGTVTLTTQPGMASYDWTFTPSGKAGHKSKKEDTSNTYVVSASGSVTVTVTDTNGCSGTSASFPVIISTSLPAPVITGAASSCGTPVLLSTDLVAGYTYQWSNLAGPITGATSNTYSATAADTYTVTVTSGVCSGTSAPHAVAFNAGPTPTITGPSANVCPDGTVTLTTQSGMASYDWTFTPSGKAGHKSKKEDTSNTYVVTASGSVTVTVTDTNGCSATSAPFPVIISTSLPAPVITGAAASCGTPVLLSTDLVTGYSYQWSNLAGPITGATSNTYSATAADTYTVTVTSGVCSGTSAPHAVAFNAGPTPTITGPSTNVCPDGTVTLTTQSGMSNYIWIYDRTTGTPNKGHGKREDAGNTYEVTALGAGTVTVTYTDGNGCTGTSAPFAVTISTSLPAPAITGASASCGTPVLLSTPLVGGYTYQWSNLAGPITGATSNTYSATAADTYTVTVTSGACSGTSAPHAVVFNAGPTPTITGPSANVCPDGTVTLTTQSGMASYDWTFTPSGKAGHKSKKEDTSNTYVVSASGSVTVTVTDTNGCSGTSASFPVTITTSLPAPVITGAAASCGTPVLLSTDLVAGYTYLWSNLAGPITGATSNTYSATAADTYTVTVTSGVCSGTSAPHAVAFNAGPTPTVTGPFTNTCPSVFVTLTTQPGMSNYIWYFTPDVKVGKGKTKHEDDAGNTLVVDQSGTGTVTYTDGNGCTGTSAPFTVTVSTLITPTISGGTTGCSAVALSTEPGMSDYQWYLDGNPISGATGATYTATGSGSYTVLYYQNGPCNGMSAPHVVTINGIATPTITGPSVNTCPDGTVTLTTQSGMASYNWNFTPSGKASNKSKKESDGSTYVVTASGSVTVTVTNSDGCSATSAPFTVTINTTLTPAITGAWSNICPSVAVALSTDSGMSNYQWFVGGSAITGANDATYTATASGDYTVSYTNGSCSGTSAGHAVTITSCLVPPNPVPYSVTPVNISTTNAGTDGTIHWDVTNCASTNYHIVYGKGENLASWTLDGGKCGIGTTGAYTWTSMPDPTTNASRFEWFLVVGDDGANTEGSWGKDSSGNEEGGTNASNVCGFTAKDTSHTCTAEARRK